MTSHETTMIKIISGISINMVVENGNKHVRT